MHNSNTIIKFADDSTVVGLITDNDETAYREEVRDLAGWCQNNNLSLSVAQTKEMIAACHPGPLHQAVSEEGPKNGQRPQPLQS
ncbi:unnamed protein product [Oncorhynchus mykiss]|uniref:Reverse transcriptase domain-containing protein n=1 Tax=Oncorhynchus mykiss TaxID=8022 RepID=A0A060Y9S7_ONCMY|nr:unnamed protein product [Oncorhynchus mykiss]